MYLLVHAQFIWRDAKSAEISLVDLASNHSLASIIPFSVHAKLICYLSKSAEICLVDLADSHMPVSNVKEFRCK